MTAAKRRFAPTQREHACARSLVSTLPGSALRQENPAGSVDAFGNRCDPDPVDACCIEFGIAGERL